MSWVPNINPDYPMFYYIFKAAGAGIFPPVLGFDVGPAVVMLGAALLISLLDKIYIKFFASKQPEVIVLTKEQFIDKLNEHIKNEEEKNNGN